MGGRSRNSRKKYRKTKPQRILIRCGFLVGAGGLKEPGSRLPAAASCLGRHAHPAGRSPNSSSLFLPLAAVVAVAQGLSPAGLFGGSMLFESTRSISLISSQNKNLSVLYMLRLFGGRGWITRAALLKTAHWAVFTLSSATAPQLFESTLAAPFSRQVKQKLRYPLDTGVLGGAKQPKSEPLPSGASLAAISSKVMVFVPSL